ncbi:MAG: MgtC/SapB family protein [Armatimonadota bacterium]
MNIFEINTDITQFELFFRLFAAAALAALIGLERERSHRAAGLRTYTLVAIGSALFTLVGIYGFFSDAITRDPARVAAQIVTGIGFLGAGTILRHGLAIRGLTTAAGLWAAAAIGMACGVGWYSISLFSTLLVILVLGLLKVLETAKGERIPIMLYFKIPRDAKNMDKIREFMKNNKLVTMNVEIEEDESDWAYKITADAPPNITKENFINNLSSCGATGIKWKGIRV